jgi:hypothetical protein
LLWSRDRSKNDRRLFTRGIQAELCRSDFSALLTAALLLNRRMVHQVEIAGNVLSQVLPSLANARMLSLAKSANAIDHQRTNAGAREMDEC